MKSLLLISIGVLTVGGMALLTGCAGHPRHGCHGNPEKTANFITHKIAKELKLSPEQKNTLEGIKAEILSKYQTNRGDHKEMFDQAKTLILSDQIDPTQLSEMIDQKMEKHKLMKDFLISKFVEFHAILTPEQRTLLVEKLAKHHDQLDRFHQ